jgi:hypothetical protein
MSGGNYTLDGGFWGVISQQCKRPAHRHFTSRELPRTLSPFLDVAVHWLHVATKHQQRQFGELEQCRHRAAG